LTGTYFQTLGLNTKFPRYFHVF